MVVITVLIGIIAQEIIREIAFSSVLFVHSLKISRKPTVVIFKIKVSVLKSPHMK